MTPGTSKFERAMSSTANLLTTVGSYLQAGYSRVIDFVWQEIPRVTNRNRNRVVPFDDGIQIEAHQRSQSQTNMVNSGIGSLHEIINEEEEKSSSDDNLEYFTAHGGSRSRSNFKSAVRSARTASRPPVMQQQIDLGRIIATDRATSRSRVAQKSPERRPARPKQQVV